MSDKQHRAPAGPLAGIVVADFSRILAGPLVTQMLADDGATVIKVEDPARGDETRRWGPPFVEGESAYYLGINRGKQLVALDLGSAKGRIAARELVAGADVVIHNFRPAQEARFGLDARSVKALNPAAVHCVIRGFEPGTGDESLPGFDLLAQAVGGMMAITGAPDGDPMKTGVAISDILTAHWARAGILSALLDRERTGVARGVEISLVGATLASLANVGQSHLLTGAEPRRWGNAHPSIVPYEVFHGSDRAFVVAVGSDPQWARLCTHVLEDDALARDMQYVTNALRVENRGVLIPRLQRAFASESASRWVERCRSVDIPAALVATYAEMFEANAHLVETLEHPTIGELRVVGNPVRYDGVRFTSPVPPPVRSSGEEPPENEAPENHPPTSSSTHRDPH